MVRGMAISLFLFVLLVSTITEISVQAEQRFHLGEKFTYAENMTTTTTDLLTGETSTEHEDTIYTQRVVELSDPLTDVKDGVEKTYSFVRITPPNKRAELRLLSQRTREDFTTYSAHSKPLSVGDKWNDAVVNGLKRNILVTRVYHSNEYDTEALTLDVEVSGTVSVLDEIVPMHSLMTMNIDAESGILLSMEKVERSTVITSRITKTTVQKLVQRDSSHYEL